MIELEKAHAQLESLKLYTAANILDSRLQLAAQNNQTYVSFLVDLLQEGVSGRNGMWTRRVSWLDSLTVKLWMNLISLSNRALM